MSARASISNDSTSALSRIDSSTTDSSTSIEKSGSGCATATSACARTDATGDLSS